MPDPNNDISFKIAVSKKPDGSENASKKTDTEERRIFFYAEKIKNGALFVQALNGNDCPSGERRNLTLDAFMDQFTPEPLYYYNKVKPVMDFVQSSLEKGESALRDRNFSRAETAFKQVLSVDEEDIRANFGLGLAYLGAGKKDDALGVLGKLMSLDLAFEAGHKHMFNSFGIQMRKSGMLGEAIDYYKKAISLHPQDEHLHFNMARVLHAGDNHPACCESLVNALGINPEFHEAAAFLKYLVEHDATLKNLPGVCPHVDAAPDEIRYPGLDLDNAPWLEQ